MGADGFTVVGGQTFFGIDIDPITHGERYGLFVFGLFVLCALSVASIRRGVVGRRLIAVRTNERAAAALGISVFGVKLYAFGVRLGDRGASAACSSRFATRPSPTATSCRSQSILAVTYTVIGGIGFVLGAPFGSQLVQGGFGTWLLDSFPWWGMLVLGGILFAYARSRWSPAGSWRRLSRRQVRIAVRFRGRRCGAARARRLVGLVYALQEGQRVTAGGADLRRTRTRAGSS